VFRGARPSDYALLGVTPQASAEELLSAYRRRARDLHPDVRPDDPEADARFQDLTEAYETLARRARLRRPTAPPPQTPAQTPRQTPTRQSQPPTPQPTAERDAPEPPLRAGPPMVRPLGPRRETR
jgi:DnaJ-like protein